MASNNSIKKTFFSMCTSFDEDYYVNQSLYNKNIISCKKTKKNYPQVFTDNKGHTYFRTRGTFVDTANIVDVIATKKDDK
jgi:hypothetical protein